MNFANYLNVNRNFNSFYFFPERVGRLSLGSPRRLDDGASIESSCHVSASLNTDHGIKSYFLCPVVVFQIAGEHRSSALPPGTSYSVFKFQTARTGRGCTEKICEAEASVHCTPQIGGARRDCPLSPQGHGPLHCGRGPGTGRRDHRG